ncbi:MAG: LysM peptidoglycan-binding domain-containing protein [Legionella sp.]
MSFKSLNAISLCLFLLFYSYFINAAELIYAPNTWDVLRKQFTLNHQVNQPEVQHQLRWLVSHPGYLERLAQSKPYMYHIVTEINKRNLPGELALVPMIESAFDPFAYSGMGAAGLWQLMPGTGTDLGLKRDWWYDGRRSIQPSTNAALNYLTYLNRLFNGDWILAFAAYDSGEGTVSRAIKHSQQAYPINFWTLTLPQETKAYIPRLLALAEIIQNPERYQIKLPPIAHVPYFEEVNIGSQIDLKHAAQLAGISYRDLIKLNPGFNHWTTAPYSPFKLLIPADRVDDFSRNLASIPQEKRVSWIRHQVTVEDNLYSIAHKYHTTIQLIKRLNQLTSNALKIGQLLIIPNSNRISIRRPIDTIHSQQTIDSKQKTNFKMLNRYKVLHIVQKNETIALLEHRYGVRIKTILQWNRLDKPSRIKPGTQLIIWKEVT